MRPTKFMRPSPPKLRKPTFAVPSKFSRTMPPTPLLSCMLVKGAYDGKSDTDGKDAASLDPSASVLSRTTSTGMTNLVSNKVLQRRNMKAEANERQHQQEPRKEQNNRSRTNATMKARRRKNRKVGMKGCLTEAMAPRGARGHDDERGSNDTDMVDLKKDLSFIITRDEARGSPSLKDEGCSGSS